MKTPNPRTLLTLALALLLGGLVHPASAQPDPRLSWQTMETPHFLIHFPDGAHEAALATADRLEQAHTLLSPLLAHVPRRRTEVVLTDQSDDANGSATAFPFPQINARLAPPGADSILGHYDDYLWILLVHEYVHVLHLDHTEGLPDLGNRIFGRLFSPNGFQPSWIVEGIATRYETLLSGQGRNRSARVDMILRAQVLEESGLWRAGRLTAGPTSWPGATLWYLYGGRIWETIVRESGESAPTKMVSDYAGRVLPFAYNLSAEATTGRSLEDYYDTWREEETARHQETLDRIEREGRLEGERLTHLGRSVHQPRPLPGGRLIFSASDGEHFPGIHLREPDGSVRRLRRLSGLDAFELAPHGESVIVIAREQHQTFQFTSDLFAASLEGGELQRLTAGLRATHLSLSPGGDRVAFVAQRRGQMALYLAELHLPLPTKADGDAPEATARLGPIRRILSLPDTQLDRITFCPEGDHLAVSLHPPGGSWDLGLLSLGEPTGADPSGELGALPAPDAGPAGQEALTLLASGPEDAIHPTFSPDHRWLVYSADHQRVPDLFALDLQAPEAGPRRLSRVRTGAYEPRFTPDGEALSYVGYTADGYDLFLLALPAGGIASLEIMDSSAPTRERSHFAARPRAFPVRAYRPLATLRPHYWMPSLGGDAKGTTLGLVTGGSDIVGKHAWAGSLWVGAISLEPGFSLAYRHAASIPSLELGTTTYLGLASTPRRDGPRQSFFQRVSTLSVNLAADDAHLDRFQGVGLGMNVRRLSVRGVARPLEAGERPTALPESIWFNSLSAYWTASSVHGFAESVSAEEGVRLTLQAGLSSRLFGSASDTLDLSLFVHGYQPVPFARRQVVAFRLRASAGLGRLPGRTRYSLGGPGLRDPFRAAIEGTGLSSTVLRGFPAATFVGEALLATSTEYRFPIWEIDRGEGLLPLFVRRIWGAVFLDVGTAGDLPELLLAGSLGAGAGGELRVEFTVGYALPLQLRLGLARGLTTGGITEVFAGLGGVF